MKHVVLGLAMGLAVGAAAAQQVWRCEQDGQVRYTDQPCEKSGRPLPPRQLKTNVAEGIAAEAALAEAPASAASGASLAAEPPASAALAASDAVAVGVAAPQPPAASSRRSHRVRFTQVAMRGLMDTDFVQRGYVRRQNPTSTANP